MDKFSTKLKMYQKNMKLSQGEVCALLYGVPMRTVQSWILGEKEPPLYYQKLILFRLEYLQKNNVSDK